MSLARLSAAIQLIPPGHPAGQWLRERVAYFQTGRHFGITLEAALEIEPSMAVTPRKIWCYRRDSLMRKIASEFFAAMIDTDAARQIAMEIERYRRADWPDDRDRGRPGRRRSPLRRQLFDLLSLNLPVHEKTILRAIRGG